jgi:hypothetical protein
VRLEVERDGIITVEEAQPGEDSWDAVRRLLKVGASAVRLVTPKGNGRWVGMRGDGALVALLRK